MKDIADKKGELEQEWVKAVTAKGVDGARALADFRAETRSLAGK
jgi:hypothetical protein